MERFFLSVAMLFVATICLSQSITGIVTDDTRKPLPDANVMLGGSTQSHTTDSNGQFSIAVRKGDIRIVVLSEGYLPYDEKLTVGDGVTRLDTIILQIKRNPLDKLHILESISDSRTPMTHEAFEHEYIERRNIVRDVPYILEQTPSFVPLSEGGSGLGVTSCRIRGMCGEAIGVTMNGIPLYNMESRLTMWNHLPDLASFADHITITRGAGSSTDCSYAYGANIDIATQSPSSKPYGDIIIAGGSFKTIKSLLSAGTGTMKNGFSIDLKMSKTKSDGYIKGAGLNHNVIMLSATWRGKANSLTANIIHGRQKTGITMWGCPSLYMETNRRYNSAGEYFDYTGQKQYYENEEESHNQTHVQLIYSQKIWDNVELNVKLHYNRGDGYYEEYLNRQNFSSYGLANISIPTIVTINGSTYTTYTILTYTDLIRRRLLSNNLYFGDISATHKIGKFVNTFGGGANLYNGHYYGNLIWMQYAGSTEKEYKWYSNISHKAEYHAYYKAEYTFFDKLTLYADLNYRIVNYEMSGTDCDLLPDGTMKTLGEDLDYNFFNPKGGINYEITPNMRLYASVARTNKEPSRNNIKDLVGTTKSIDNETLVDYELGYSYKSKIFTGSMNLYYMDFQNQIVPTGDFSQYGYYVVTNVDKSYRTGVEISANVCPHKRLSINANATFSRNRIKDYAYNVLIYDENLNETYEERHVINAKTAYSPEIIASGNINYNIFGNFNVYYNVKYVGKQHFDNTSSNDRTLKAYCINSIGFDYAIVAKYVKRLRFNFEVNNLFI